MTLRVVQWATGNVGSRSLRAVIEHPDLDLVGVYVYSDSKVGKDAGELCGLAPIGVAATNDVDAIAALRPDCVLFMGDRLEVEALCRLLERGSNVVATRPIGADAVQRIEDACHRGGTTWHSTGSSPGFITEALPIVLTSIGRRLDRLTIDEFADVSSRDSPELLFAVMGFGRDPSAFGAQRWEHGALAFGPSLTAVASAWGVPLDEVVATGEVAVARRALTIAAGTIEEGTVAAQRMIVSGMRSGAPLVRFRANWYCGTDIEPGWALQGSGWRVAVEGDTPLDVRITFPVEAEDYAAFTPGLTAHRPVNAIPFVCNAPPGIVTTADLPQVIARFGA